MTRAEPLRYLAACFDDGALLRWTDERAPLYRDARREPEASAILAGVPLDGAVAIRALRRRVALAGALLVTEGAGAVCFAWVASVPGVRS